MIPAISGAIGPLGPSEWGVGSVGGVGQSPSTSVNGASTSNTSRDFSPAPSARPDGGASAPNARE